MARTKKSIPNPESANIRTPAASGEPDVPSFPARGYRMPSPLTADPVLMTPGERLAAFGRLFASAFLKRGAHLTSSSHSSANHHEG